MLQVPEKGGKFGAKLTHRCGFWLDLPVKNIFRSHNWLELIWFLKKVKQFKAIFKRQNSQIFDLSWTEEMQEYVKNIVDGRHLLFEPYLQ